LTESHDTRDLKAAKVLLLKEFPASDDLRLSGKRRAALIAHGFAHQFRQAAHECKGCFLPGALREAREAHHVGEKDGEPTEFQQRAALESKLRAANDDSADPVPSARQSALRPPRSGFTVWAGTALSSRVLGRGTIMTTPSKAALRAELEAALANYRGPVKQCPAAPPPEEELETLDDEDEADEAIVPGPH
jgi:hypothetical protein